MQPIQAIDIIHVAWSVSVCMSVCVSVCLLDTIVSPAKTAAPIEMPSELRTRAWGPKTRHVLGGGRERERTLLGSYLSVFAVATSVLQQLSVQRWAWVGSIHGSGWVEFLIAFLTAFVGWVGSNDCVLLLFIKNFNQKYYI